MSWRSFELVSPLEGIERIAHSISECYRDASRPKPLQELVEERVIVVLVELLLVVGEQAVEELKRSEKDDRVGHLHGYGGGVACDKATTHVS